MKVEEKGTCLVKGKLYSYDLYTDEWKSFANENIFMIGKGSKVTFPKKSIKVESQEHYFYFYGEDEDE